MQLDTTALAEVLDLAQNHTFRDHCLDATRPTRTFAGRESQSWCSRRAVVAAARKTGWAIHFMPKRAGTEPELGEVMNAPLGGLTPAALALIGKPPAKEVAANLHRFKELMEDGKVSDTSHSVPGSPAAECD